MKKLLVALIFISLASPSFADQKIRASSFLSTENQTSPNANRFSHIEYHDTGKKPLKQHKIQWVGTQKFNKQALNNKLNKSFGSNNVNATRTLWSNLNN